MSIKVGVLMGGDSHEREVSISTGMAVFKACESLGYVVTKFLFVNNYKKFINKLKEQDIIFNALHGGIGENGSIQAWMDNSNIKYTGSGSRVSSLCMDKSRSKSFARLMGIETADWQKIKNINESIELKLPLVIKPNEQGSTFGLTIVREKAHLKQAIKKAFQYGEAIIAEKYLRGREITVPVLGGKVYPIIEILPSHGLYDYECKYTQGFSKYICPAKLDNGIARKIREDTELIFNEFGCDVYARIDYIIDHYGHPNFLEVNTLPGMTNTSLFPKSVSKENVSFERLIKKILKLSL